MPQRIKLSTEIVLAYARAQHELRRVPIEVAVKRLRAPATRERTGDPELLEEARSLGWIVARELAHLPGDTRCLVRSLVVTRLLARRGIPATLVIGARSGPDFLAHAWVEHAGSPVIDPGDGTFGRLVEI
jgi:hypothetical protein